ncbi:MULTISPECIES: helix-turn-helix domain-containing protein [Actinomadura]|uniref:Helix-turn-helix domain-containing protein n=1 Tax=Actinomadura yumaensis TaxID=111807 RepID=A0ABW2CZD5_9ACTN|nr:DUF6597 domain-containing transcriptional factor [Actinomadura sp. J1-007]MWK32691.1 helix-turn-helix domain-containing protein [Actinomadura sp. J1-007]
MNPTGYQEAPAPQWPGLACVWRSELPLDAAEPFVQRVVPDGCVDLIWSRRDGSVQVAGPDTRPAPALMRPGDALVGVRFAPGTAPSALGVPADAVRDGRIPLRDLWGDDADRLGEAVAASGAPAKALAEAAARRARAGEPVDPLVAPLIAGLGRAPVRTVAAELGLGERQLRRRTIAAFGYGPKTVQRVLRFQRALRLARGGMPLADVAHAAGYADQPHLSHDVRALADTSIRTLL